MDMTARAVLLWAIEEYNSHNPPPKQVGKEQSGYEWVVKFKNGRPVYVEKLERSESINRIWGFGEVEINEILR